MYPTWVSIHQCLTKRAVMKYLTKYVTKLEPPSQFSKDITERIIQSHNPANAVAPPQAVDAFKKMLMDANRL